MINDNINNLEPIIDGFLKESSTLMGLARDMRHSERNPMFNRAFIAKEICHYLLEEVKSKKDAVVKLKKMK